MQIRPWHRNYDTGVTPELTVENIPLFAYLQRAAINLSTARVHDL